MRRLLATRGAAAAAIGVLVALAAGGSFALASSSGKTIHACVHRRSGDIYVAKKCAKHDRKLSWNLVGRRGATGPAGAQGPGATYLVYNAGGGSSNAPTPIGTLGPFTFSGVCTTSGGGTTSSTIGVTESGARVDGLIVSGSTALTVSANLGALSGGVFDTGASSSTTPQMASSDELVIPTSGTAIQLQQTFTVTGGSANTCHFSATATPTHLSGSPSASTARTAARIPATAHTSGLVVAGERIH